MDFTRREVMSMLSGVAGVCIGRPQQTEGPYYLDSKLNRSDIRSDPSDGSIAQGVPLSLEFHVSRVASGSCVPLEGAIVDVWHCDARGIYSGVRDAHFNTTGKKFLRGYQITNKSGIARFRTVYPGWYPGRTVHMHFKIRSASDTGGLEFTSQLYFDDAVTDQVCRQKPYSLSGERMMRNDNDGIFRAGGEKLMLELVKDGEGYRAVFEIAV